MHSNLFMYLAAMSAVSIHNLANNIEQAAWGSDTVDLKTLPSTNWTLDNAAALAASFPQCNGTQQSPVEIETARTRENLNLRLGLTAYDKPVAGFVANKFPTFRLLPFSFEWPRPSALISNNVARSFNPYADSHFVLDYVEFHWSAGDGAAQQAPPGHRLNNQSGPLEIHFVHLNSAYANQEEALSRPDGLLIFAVAAAASTHESYMFDRLLDTLANLTEHEQRADFHEDSTWRSLLPADTSRFFRYQGSLVGPPCHESVQWVVFEERLRLGHKQLRRLGKFRTLGRYWPAGSRGGQLVDWAAQRRPLQPLNNRTIERSFPGALAKRSPPRT